MEAGLGRWRATRITSGGTSEDAQTWLLTRRRQRPCIQRARVGPDSRVVNITLSSCTPGGKDAVHPAQHRNARNQPSQRSWDLLISSDREQRAPAGNRGAHRLQESTLSASVSSTPSDSQTPAGIPEVVFFSFFPTEVYDLIQKRIQRNSTARHLRGLTLQALRRAINRPWKAVWSRHRRTHTRGPRRQRQTPPELEVLHCVRGGPACSRPRCHWTPRENSQR